jgi:leucyl/phenylalanyl-tRNA--protein transferase
MIELSPEIILQAYAAGLFPMADSAESDHLYWFDPEQRGILPLEHFHLPRRLARTVRKTELSVTHDRCFDNVVACCGMQDDRRSNTWINRDIRRVYGQLHKLGYAHSIEVFDRGELVGGLYGVAIGAAFFGESMFSRVRDASKIALVHLAARLIAGRFRLLDTQFVTEHLRQFGAVEIPRPTYRVLLDAAINADADFYCGEESELLEAFLQSSTQTS